MTNSIANAFQQWRYLVLLSALLALLVVQPIASAMGVMQALFDILFVVVMVVLVLALAQNRILRVVALILCIPAAALLIGGHFLTSTAQNASLSVGHALGALFFVMVAGMIVRNIFVTRGVSLDSLFGVICGYLLLGVAWGLTYAMVYTADPTSFHVADPIGPYLAQTDYQRSLFIYYSFITLTTVGYGDVTPLSIPARTLSWAEAVTGQLYLAVLIAGLISALVAKKTAPDRTT